MLCAFQVRGVRLPREGGEGGRLRGFGYAEFESRQDLVDALAMNELVTSEHHIFFKTMSNYYSLIS